MRQFERDVFPIKVTRGLQHEAHPLLKRPIGQWSYDALTPPDVCTSDAAASERLVNLLATFCILSWRIFWLTMINRAMPSAPPTLAFTGLEIRLPDQLLENNAPSGARNSLSSYLIRMARFGGYLARANDPAPGNTVIWRGMSRLTDIEIGFMLGAQHGGN